MDRIANPNVQTSSARVAETPHALVGGVEEVGSPHLLGRVGSIGRLRSGQIVVVETTTNEVRAFDPEGRHRWTFGRRGEGPGEFQRPRFLGQASDDSLLVWDDRLARMTFLTPSGELKEVRGSGSLVEEIPPRPRAVLSNDLLVGSFPGEGAPDEFTNGQIVQDFSDVFLTDLDYSERTFVTEITGARFQVFLTPDPEFTALPFTAAAWFTAAGDDIVAVGPNDRGVSVFSSGGELVREMWVERSPRPVTDQDWTREVERRLDGLPEEERANEERRLQRLDIPDLMPTYDRVLGDGTGMIWARHYVADFSDRHRWDRFTDDGRFVGVIETPDRLDIRQIGPDWMLGIHYDEVGIPSVRLHRFEEPTADE